MTQIFIEGQPIDTNDGFSALLTLALDDLKDFASRNTSFSKTIILPGSIRNAKVFGHVFDVRSANPYTDALPNVNINFNAAKRARCVIFQDNIQSFKGFIRLLEIVLDKGTVEYEVAVFGELYGLIASIGRNRLEDLDFSAYNHTYNYTNINASWDDYNAGEGYYYPLIDYGGYSTNKDHWNVLTFRPALFAREYLQKIFAAAGYTYDFTLIDTERFKRLIVPYNRKALTTLSTEQLNAQRTSSYTILDSGTGDTAIIQYQTVTNPAFTVTVLNSRFEYTGANSSLNIDITVNGNFISKGDYYTIGVYLNGALIPGQEYITTVYGDSSTYNFSTTFSFIQALVSGDYIQIFCERFPNDTVTVEKLVITSSSFIVTSEAAIVSPIAIGDAIVVNDCIPKNIVQRDFLTSLVQLFNLYIYEDPDKENHVKITPYVDFYTDAERVDWSLKVDRASPIKITPMSNLNARFYDFKFRQDSDYYNDLYQKRYNEGYGQYIFDSAFDFEDDRQAVELIFSPTPLVGYPGEDKVFSSILKIENNIETQTDSNIRLLQALKVTGVTGWNITGQASGLTVYPYAGHYDDPDAPSNDIQFGVPRELFFTVASGNLSTHQFNLYWSSYMAEVSDKDSRLMRCKMRLTVADIATLDFAKLIWIDGALWRLVKITDYNMSMPDLCEVELLKVIEVTY